MDLSPDAPQSQQGSPVRPSTAAARAGAKDDDAVAVRVAVHIRPLVENELAKGCQEILDVTPDTPQVSTQRAGGVVLGGDHVSVQVQLCSNASKHD